MPNQEIDQTTLPSRLREASFRKYEKVIADAINTFPDIVIVKPTGNLNTYVARLRDAILSMARYGWDSETIIRNVFLRVHDQLTVAQVDDKIVLGSVVAIRAFKQLGLVASEAELLTTSSVVEPYVMDADKWTHDDLDAKRVMLVICELASARVLSRPITIVNVEMSPSMKSYYEDNYDVVVELNADESFTIS